MNAEQYLDYLIMTARQGFEIPIQASELEMLRALLRKEYFAPGMVNEKGNG